MTESTTSAGQLKFKAPASDEWCALPADGQDKDQQENTRAARDTLKETLITARTTEYPSRMQVATGTVVGGKVVLESLDLAEGETVTVLIQESAQEVHLSPEDEAELLEAIAEADRGETISAEELFARLDRIR